MIQIQFCREHGKMLGVGRGDHGETLCAEGHEITSAEQVTLVPHWSAAEVRGLVEQYLSLANADALRSRTLQPSVVGTVLGQAASS